MMLLTVAIAALQACSCAENETLPQALARSEIVFAGTVSQSFWTSSFYRAIAQRPFLQGFLGRPVVSFAVREVFKGQAGKEIDILLERPGLCSMTLDPGVDYLVFATRDPETGKLHARSSCSRTMPIEYARGDIEELRAQKKSRIR